MSSFTDIIGPVGNQGPQGPVGNQGPPGPGAQLLYHSEAAISIYMTTVKTTLFTITLAAGKVKVGDRIRIRVPAYCLCSTAGQPGYTYRLESPAGSVWLTSAVYVPPVLNGGTTPHFVDYVIDVISTSAAKIMMYLFGGAGQSGQGSISGAGTGGGAAVYSQLTMGQMNVNLTVASSIVVTCQANYGGQGDSQYQSLGAMAELLVA
jgi:hypothetical protein